MRVCRGCSGDSGSTDMRGLFELNNPKCEDRPPLAEMFMICSGRKIKNDDGLPQLLCLSCEMKVNLSYDFRTMCEKSEKKLQKTYKPDFVIQNISDAATSHTVQEAINTLNLSKCSMELSGKVIVVVANMQGGAGEDASISNICNINLQKPEASDKEKSQPDTKSKKSVSKVTNNNSTSSSEQNKKAQVILEPIRKSVESKRKQESDVEESVEAAPPPPKRLTRSGSTSESEGHNMRRSTRRSVVVKREPSEPRRTSSRVVNSLFSKRSLEQRRQSRAPSPKAARSASPKVREPRERPADSEFSMCASCKKRVYNTTKVNCCGDDFHPGCHKKHKICPKPEESKAKETKQKEDSHPPVLRKEPKTEKVENAANLFCEKCKESFSSKMELLMHINFSSEHNPLNAKNISNTCSDCNKEFTKRAFLIKHLSLYHAQGQAPTDMFKCEVCDKIFGSKRNLRIHRKTHEKLHDCHLCDASFVSDDILKKHLGTHSVQVKTEAMEESKKGKEVSASNKDKANKSIKVEEHSDFFKCDFCPVQTSRLSDLYRHRTMHTECPVCFKDYSSTKGMLNHLRHSHLAYYNSMANRMQKAEYKCNICRAVTKSKSEQVAHQIIHKTCPICKEKFLSYTKMMQHLRQDHTPDEAKPYVSKLTQNSNVTVKTEPAAASTPIEYPSHDSPTLEETTYECTFCRTGLNTKSVLLLHCKKHNAGMLYYCIDCDVCFPNVSEWVAHKDVHSDVRNHVVVASASYKRVVQSCKDCSTAFHRMTAFKNHKCKKAPIQSDIAHKKTDSEFKIGEVKIRKLASLSMDPSLEEKMNNAKRMECHLCSLTFENAVKLIDHLKSHQPSTQVTQNSNIPTNITKPTRVPSPQLTYRCKVCNETLNSKIDLDIHSQRHGTNVTLYCATCNLSYPSESSWNSHVGNNHPDVKEIQYIVGKPEDAKQLVLNSAGVMKVKSALTQMAKPSLIAKKHTAPVRRHQCSNCGASFDRKALYQDHVDNGCTSARDCYQKVDDKPEALEEHKSEYQIQSDEQESQLIESDVDMELEEPSTEYICSIQNSTTEMSSIMDETMEDESTGNVVNPCYETDGEIEDQSLSKPIEINSNDEDESAADTTAEEIVIPNILSAKETKLLHDSGDETESLEDGETEFECTECPMKFALPNLLFEHLEKEHLDYTCKVCFAVFVSPDHLVKHMDVEHKE